MSIERRDNRGFTLIELLVVMAISIILIGLVLAPVIQSFNLTRRAQAMVDAQDASRLAMVQISRELGQAMFVFDNADQPLDLPVDAGSSTVWLPMKFAKVDFILPKITMHCNAPEGNGVGQHPAGAPRDYDRGNDAWPPCPVCRSTDVEARPKLPIEQDETVVRYFLGLADNRLENTVDNKNLGWLSPWNKNVDVDAGNQVVLYRVEFSPYDDKLFPKDEPVADRLRDPRFFYNTGTSPGGITYAERWAQIARVVGVGKYEDLVVGTAAGNSPAPTSVEPTITFRTSAIDNDTFAGAYSSDAKFDVPDAVPTIFRGAYGFWTPGFRVSLYRDNYNTAYSTDLQDGDLVVFKWVYQNGAWTQTPQFNISQYVNSGAITNPSGGDVEMAFVVDANRGEANFALVPPRPNNAKTGPICTLDPDVINQDFRTEYDASRTAIRHAPLSTFVPGSSNYLKYARVVPGSERVVGPDMTPNADPSRLVRYERVPLNLGSPGLNQYKIDYDAGEIFFSSVWDEDLPVVKDAGGSPVMIGVDYKVQFNRSDDVVRGDYATKSLVTVHLGMRMFDPESGKEHRVDLNKSVKVRNELR